MQCSALQSAVIHLLAIALVLTVSAVPGVAATSVTQNGQTFHFTYTNGADVIDYQYSPGTLESLEGTFSELQVEVNNAYSFYPSWVGGPRVLLNGTEYWPWEGGFSRSLVGTPALNDSGTPSDSSDDYVEATFRWSEGNDDVEFSYRLSMDGPTLLVDVSASEPKVLQWYSGRTEDQNPNDDVGDPPIGPYIIPSMPYASAVVRHPVHPVFLAVSFDLSVSQASLVDTWEFWQPNPGSVAFGENAEYQALTDGTRQTSSERMEITVSPDLTDLFRPLPAWTGTSEYRDDLRKRVVFDSWGGWDGQFSFEAALERLQTFFLYGFRDLQVIRHDWQRYGYDVKLPDTTPPNPAYGGEQGMLAYLAGARSLGYRVALHQNYLDYYPDAPSYDPGKVALKSDGSPVFGWLHPLTGVQAHQLKPTEARGVMENYAPTIASYGPSASYLDSVAAIRFGERVDHDSTVVDPGSALPVAAKGATQIAAYKELVEYAKSVYNGPVFSEGGLHALWAGVVDGVEGEATPLADQGWDQLPPLVDYDLLRIHPRMVNHGVSYFIRIFPEPTGPPEMEYYNTARAMTVAYGRAGWIDTTWNLGMTDPTALLLEAFREYYLMRPVQERIATASALEIRYELDGDYRTISQAVLEDDAWRLRVVWDSGVTVWVNRGPSPWTISPGDGNSYELPPVNGWLAYQPGSNGLLAYSIVLGDGSRKDQVEAPEFTYSYVSAPQSLGAAAIVPNSEWDTRDIHSIGVESVESAASMILGLSSRCDFNLAWTSETRAVASLTECSDSSIDIVYQDVPDSWRDSGGALQEALISIWTLDANGRRLTEIPWTSSASSSIGWTATNGSEYELALAECADGIDNDRDGLIDLDDPDCAEPNDPLEAPDADGDLVEDDLDNCIDVPNGDQRDSDLDGYGNVCDCDLNNDWMVDFLDLGVLKSRFFTSDPDCDINGDGICDFLDLGRCKVLFFQPPGPSGLSCAGTVPCP